VVLVIDSSRISAPIRYEAAEPGGKQYPHIYGALPVSAVTNAIDVSRDSAGDLALPS
jgi:uncharacterized protein (DUF952 family)